MRIDALTRRVVPLVAAALLVLPVGTATAARSLPTKTTEVNEITVEVSPRRVNSRGAVIAIILDTHEGALDVDLRRRSTLTVDGTPWPVDSYQGDGPGGHHREGTLRFRSAGPVSASMRLVITGLGGTAKLSWKLPSS